MSQTNPLGLVEKIIFIESGPWLSQNDPFYTTPIVKKYCAFGPFTKHTKRIQDFLNTGNLSYIYENDLDKVCFQHNMACNKFKNLEKRAQSDIV